MSREARLIGLGVAVLAAVLALVPAAGAATRHEIATKRLAKTVDRISARYGIERKSRQAIAGADLSTTLTKRLAKALGGLRACDKLTRKAARRLRKDGIQGLRADTPRKVGRRYGPKLRKCAAKVRRRLAAIKRRAAQSAQSAQPLDLWPVLRYEPGAADNTYVHDYVLLVDRGGDDRYFNNGGAGVLDVFRGPPGSLAPIVAPAEGCEGGFDIVRPAKCVLGNAALIDDRGNDTYGRLQTPRFDAYCTSDPIVRRFFLQGMGLAGVGVLIDRAGNDAYTAKTLGIGAGHIGGVGYLRDSAGNDSYTAVRIAMGASTVTGLGRFRDDAGNDRYDYYSPRALNPFAPNLQPGAGGVNDELEQCDRENRQTLGAGNVLGIGVFKDLSGEDSYRAPAFSLGFGRLGGIGSFLDAGGNSDSYTGPGAAGRGNGVTISPSSANSGRFTDR